MLRAHSTRERGYKELAVTLPDGRFSHFRREYDRPGSRLSRLALTRNREMAEQWRLCRDRNAGWRMIRQRAARESVQAATIDAELYDCRLPQEVSEFITSLIQRWRRPAATIPNINRLAPGVWAHRDYKPDPSVCFFGTVWIGAGRSLPPRETVLGPAVLWDDPDKRPIAATRPIREVEFRPEFPNLARLLKVPWKLALRRAFDMAFAAFALLLTAPVFPIVCLAIWLEDGRPFFFAHQRQTLHGKPFPCIKFRSMRKDAEQIKARLEKENQADGPQFFIERDPRLTRVGALIRKLNVDELPQFVNVLLGQMSIVGPRPSPEKENQFCPAWREARLSVRPGITGLWQVMRTRRQGLDFQEWIKYDMEYVETMSWHLDLWIIYKTICLCLRKGKSGRP